MVEVWADEKRPCLGDFRPCRWYHFCSLNGAGKLPIRCVSTFKASDEKCWQPWAERNKNGTNGQRALDPLFIGPVEVYSALARRKREESVPPADCAIATQAFAAHCATEYEFVELDLNVVNLACGLLDRYPLRAYDAVQLASATVANQALDAAHLAGLVFLSADDRLNTIAAAEGLAVDNPNHH
jgi:hypothetical protein